MKATTAKLVQYIFDHFIANFIGFLIGMMSTRLVSHFFTTRSIKNLWGLAAKKTVIDKQTYSNLEWIISLIIGFIVFEFISKTAKKKLKEWTPKIKQYIARRIVGNDLYSGETRQTTPF